MSEANGNVIDLNSFEELEAELTAIRQRHSSLETRGEMLFRGQSDAGWLLRTTLERSLDLGAINFVEHLDQIARIKFEIEAVTGQRWPDINLSDIASLGEDYDKLNRAWWSGQGLPLAYLTFLRHYGFPSPLLDWTRSPRVAQFFAYRSKSSGRSAIYALSQHNMQSTSSDRPAVYRIGHYLNTDQRHFTQQSEYTVCLQFHHANGAEFVGHDIGFQDDSVQARWNYKVTKYTFPSEDRNRVLAFLDDYNLNAYSLFKSNEALMETLQARAQRRGGTKR